MKVTFVFALIATVVASLMSLGKSDKKIVVKKPLIKDTTEVIVIDSSKLNRELLVSYILDKNIAHPEIAYAIVRQESNMCSDLFKANNNLFGMKHPGVRPTKSLGRKNGFAHFEKWQHSVEDYKLYLEFVGGHKISKPAYLKHLDQNYAHEGYSEHLDNYFEEFNSIRDSLNL
jgi:hypothetical protein